MSCLKLYCNVIESIGISLDDTTNAVQIEIPENTFVENEIFCLVLNQEIPTAESVPVEIVSGDTTINVYNRIGNVLRADQIPYRRRFMAVYGVDPAHILILNHMKDSEVALGGAK